MTARPGPTAPPWRQPWVLAIAVCVAVALALVLLLQFKQLARLRTSLASGHDLRTVQLHAPGPLLEAIDRLPAVPGHRRLPLCLPQHAHQRAALHAQTIRGGVVIVVVHRQHGTSVGSVAVERGHSRGMGLHGVEQAEAVEHPLPGGLHQHAGAHRLGLRHSLEQVHLVPGARQQQRQRRAGRAGPDDRDTQRSHRGAGRCARRSSGSAGRPPGCRPSSRAIRRRCRPAPR